MTPPRESPRHELRFVLRPLILVFLNDWMGAGDCCRAISMPLTIRPWALGMEWRNL